MVRKQSNRHLAQPISANGQQVRGTVQGAVNGPVSQFSNFQRIKHHVQDTDYYSERCSATMSSSDCTERRKPQQQQVERTFATTVQPLRYLLVVYKQKACPSGRVLVCG